MSELIIGSRIIRLERVDSTNNYVKRMLPTLPDGAIVIADEQTHGKGRGGHEWISCPGKGLTFSVRLSVPADDRAVPLFNLFPAVAIVNCLRSLKIAAQIKWPNDIFMNGRKLGGILVETVSTSVKINVILGVGLNVNTELSDFPVPLRHIAGSLKSISGQEYNIKVIFKKMIQFFNQLYDKVQTENGWRSLRQKWNDYCLHINRPINVSQKNGVTTGIFTGVDEYGFAVIKSKGQQFTLRDCAHISLREDYDTCN
ncbi:biotin--[acetyl-CoA-carboxylase] ligase [candidate division KSB1 bacterium]|nr:biotin--[acetyl-CoA-carboxylase] ligase [candidate division KSB1 bacterium]